MGIMCKISSRNFFRLFGFFLITSTSAEPQFPVEEFQNAGKPQIIELLGSFFTDSHYKLLLYRNFYRHSSSQVILLKSSDSQVWSF